MLSFFFSEKRTVIFNIFSVDQIEMKQLKGDVIMHLAWKFNCQISSLILHTLII